MLGIINPVVTTTAADLLAFSKLQKEAAARMLQSFLISETSLDRSSLRAYFVEQGSEIEALLAPLCETRSELNAIVEQIDLLGQVKELTPASVVNQGFFAAQPQHDAVVDDCIQANQFTPSL